MCTSTYPGAHNGWIEWKMILVLVRRVGNMAGSYANPVPSFRFWSGCEKWISFVQNRNRLLVRNRMWKWCSGHLLVCSCDSALSFLDSRKFKPTSTTAVTSGAAKRRAECTSLGPRLKHPSLRWLTLVWPRRDVPRRFTWYCFQSSIRAQHDDLLLLLLCVLSYDTSPRKTRAGCAALLGLY